MVTNPYNWVGKCEKCKLFAGKPILVMLPLKNMVIKEFFKQWGLDFIGPLNLASSVGHTHILMAIDYFTKWIEAIPIKNNASEVVNKFSIKNILVKFNILERKLNTNHHTIMIPLFIHLFHSQGTSRHDIFIFQPMCDIISNA